MSRSGGRRGERGIALVMAVAGALVITIIAALILNLTYNQFYLSAFQSDHSAAFYASEAGIQYAYARLNMTAGPGSQFQLRRTDGTLVGIPPGQTFQQHVIGKGVGVPFIVVSEGDPPNTPAQQGTVYDHWEPDLFTGGQRGKNVVVRVIDRGAAVNPRFRIEAEAVYGNL